MWRVRSGELNNLNRAHPPPSFGEFDCSRQPEANSFDRTVELVLLGERLGNDSPRYLASASPERHGEPRSWRESYWKPR